MATEPVLSWGPKCGESGYIAVTTSTQVCNTCQYNFFLYSCLPQNKNYTAYNIRPQGNPSTIPPPASFCSYGYLLECM